MSDAPLIDLYRKVKQYKGRRVHEDHTGIIDTLTNKEAGPDPVRFAPETFHMPGFIEPTMVQMVCGWHEAHMPVLILCAEQVEEACVLRQDFGRPWGCYGVMARWYTGHIQIGGG